MASEIINKTTISYEKLYNSLKSICKFDIDATGFGNINIHNYTFHSRNYNILPGRKEYLCDIHNKKFNANPSNESESPGEAVYISDADIKENQTFRYHIFKPADKKKADRVIIFLHGFNEKCWDKYLPWAYTLCEQTGSAVVLLPIAFHMNRARKGWNDKKKMYRFSNDRKEANPDIISSSLSNAAISARMQSQPERFVWSGLQTYYDVIQFIEECRNGSIDIINKEASFDLFGFSIGAFLSEILLLTNHKNYFNESRLCMFCGGPVFNRIRPVSKFILDSEAHIALYSYLIEHIESHLKKDERLNHFLSIEHPEGNVFLSMLDYNKMTEQRESMLEYCSERIYAAALKKDTVITWYDVMNTLKGASNNINIKTDIFDMDYDYRHEDPFPILCNEQDKINVAFNNIFKSISSFYNH